MIDRDDIEQAVEIALGMRLKADVKSERAIESVAVKRQTEIVHRVLRELPAELMVQELLDVLDD